LKQPNQQSTPYDSPWTTRDRLKQLMWEWSWTLLCKWTPKPFNAWRLFILRIFGATIRGKPFVHQRAKIEKPENLILKHRACLGDGATAYSLGLIEIQEGATIAQEAYLCAGTHDFSKESMQLLTLEIKVEDGAFVGARSFIMPGTTIGKNSIVGACSVVTKKVPANSTVAGNPSKIIVKKKPNRK